MEIALQNLKDTWSRLDATRRIMIIAAAVAAFVAIFALARMSASPPSSLLYADLDPRASGEVLQALDQRGESYEIRGTAIYVPADRRDALRMSLAGAGLPANSGAGYELLDELSGFGTTSQMFDAAYWRAKEGELARTILASPSVREARVHIANPAPGPFRGDTRTTASVTVTAAGAGLPQRTADAFRFMVASSVAGLDPSDVTVIDAGTGRVISRNDDAAALGTADERAVALKARAERLLAARVGSGNAIVEVAVETVTETERVRERRIDPESRVAISTDVEESTNAATEAGGGSVTVASNLPDGDAAGGGGESQSQSNETRAVTNYDLSETTREVERGPGAIKRLTVAVLVDEAALGAAPDGTADQLADLRDLVAAAVGIDETRGDSLTVKALPFDGSELAGTDAPSGWLASLGIAPLRLFQTAVLALVALILGLFVVRPIMKAAAPAPAGPEMAMLEGAYSADETPALTGTTQSATEIVRDGEDDPTVSGPASLPAPPGERDTVAASVPRAVAPPTEVAELKRMIEDRQPDTIEILRSWLSDTPQEERP